ncbi:NAD(P)/FAD-dependent oxidoreductase [Exilibacterium tricleocarpae]|uniref:NAD(P)/FAD-dependent oxidoreductase n=1 Tax=Exilibacterium tricleocarpae TaxID=2591008 RepID=A0A545SZ16_9GAMM|nr:NAD(P)/FAD-dependent oxidoreductase [Exilibacterium tricleocarpae]TQV70215.1 NAD(P)/FAD-dependent oxidoreductase [Exilibacterium tricleocarpae]
MKHYDLAVVGGSFSGLACARSAAAKGVRTVVYERKQTPGAYTQSTGIFVKEIAESFGLPAHLTRKINGIRLYSPRLDSVDLHSEHYYFLATDTTGVLDWMARQVKIAGGLVRCGEKVDAIVRTPQRLLLTRQNTSCSYLVGADGVTSTVARQFHLGTHKHFLLGAECVVTGFERLDPDYLHVFLDARYAPGYIGWLLHGVHHTQVGVAVQYPKRPALEPFLLHLQRHFGGSIKVLGKRGGFIPCGGVVRPFAGDRVCLLGDAAGTVSPLTAGGIHPAIDIGERLGAAVADYIHYQGAAPHQVIEEALPDYRFKRYLRLLNRHIVPPNWLLNACLGNPVFQRMAQIIFFHHRGLLCKEAWREILSSR